MDRPSANRSIGQTLVTIVRRYLGLSPAPVPAVVPVPLRPSDYRTPRRR